MRSVGVAGIIRAPSHLRLEGLDNEPYVNAFSLIRDKESLSNGVPLRRFKEPVTGPDGHYLSGRNTSVIVLFKIIALQGIDPLNFYTSS